MLINKNRYQISKDRKLMHKVGKQWVVVSAFVLALLGAKGAKTMIHASSTESPDQQVTNQMNRRLQQSQKLVSQQNARQSASQSAQNDPISNVHGATQSASSSDGQDIMQEAKGLHNQIMANNVMAPKVNSLGAVSQAGRLSGKSTAPTGLSQPRLQHDQLSNSQNSNGLQKPALSQPTLLGRNLESNHQLGSANQVNLTSTTHDYDGYIDNNPIVNQGIWGTNPSRDAKYVLDNKGTLIVYGGGLMAAEDSDSPQPGQATWPSYLQNHESDIRKMIIQNALAPNDTYGLCDGGGNYDGDYMGGYMPNLREVDVTGLNMKNVTSVNSMFGGAGNANGTDAGGPTPHLQKIIGFSDKQITSNNLTNMFSGCSDLASVNISGLNTRNANGWALSGIFNGCNQLASITLGPNTILSSSDSNGFTTWHNWPQVHNIQDVFNNESYPGTWFKTPYPCTINFVNMDGDILNQVQTYSPTAIDDVSFNNYSNDVPAGYAILPGQYASNGGKIHFTPTTSTQDIEVAHSWDGSADSAFWYEDNLGNLSIFSAGNHNRMDTAQWPSGLDKNSVTHLDTNTSNLIKHVAGVGPVVYAPSDASNLFSNMNLSQFDLTGLNVSDTSNMSNMFASDANLNNVTLPTTFNTLKAFNAGPNNMAGMFRNDPKLNNIQITSANTKLHSANAATGVMLPTMYRKDTASDNHGVSDSYTNSLLHNFSDGSTGTFVSPSNVKKTTDVVRYYLNGKDTGVAKDFNGNATGTVNSTGTSFTVNNQNAGALNDTYVMNGNGYGNKGLTFNYDGGQYRVNVGVGRCQVPIRFIDQNGNTIGRIQNVYGLYVPGVVASTITLPAYPETEGGAPIHGYHLDPGQSDHYTISSNAIKTFNVNGSSTYPIDVNVSGDQVSVPVRYETASDRLVGSDKVQTNVGSDIDLTQGGTTIPKGYQLINKNSATNYKVDWHNLKAPNYNQINPPVVLRVGVDQQTLLVNYVNPNGSILYERHIHNVEDNTHVNLVDPTFMNGTHQLYGYRVDNGYNNDPLVSLKSNGTYPIETVHMIGNNAVVNVNYVDPLNDNANVGVDSITGHNTGDTISLPVPNNAPGLDSGYHLNSDQESHYTIEPNEGTINLYLDATGDPRHIQAPVTVIYRGADGTQSTSVLNVNLSGHYGDQGTSFNTDDFSNAPKGYSLANTNQTYGATFQLNNPEYQWTAHGSNAWDAANDRPELIYQAQPSNTITVHYVNQNGTSVGSAPVVKGQDNDSFDVNDNNAVIKNNLPTGLGYRYDTNKNKDHVLHFNSDAQQVNVYVIGDPETVHVEYDYPAGHKINDDQPGNTSGDMLITTNSNGQPLRVGDTVQLPIHNDQLPTGYLLGNDQTVKYTVAYADDTAKNGNILRHVNIDPDQECVPVRFINQSGQQVGCTNYTTLGKIGSTEALPDAPAGYQYKSADQKNYTFMANDISANDRHLMDSDIVNVVGDNEIVPVRYINQDGTLISGHSDMVSNVNGNQVQMGSTIKLSDIDAEGGQAPLPNDYVLDTQQPNDVSNYTLTPDHLDSANHGYMQPLNVYVKPRARQYNFVIIAREHNGHSHGSVDRIVGTKVYSDAMSGSDGLTRTFNPNSDIPTGYANTNYNNQPVTVKATDQGLINTSTGKTQYNVTWDYYPQQSHFYVVYQCNGHPVDPVGGNATNGYQHMISGRTGDTVNVTSYRHVPVPAGYYLKPGVSTDYIMPAPSNKPKVVNLQLVPKNSLSRNYTLSVTVDSPDGQRLSGLDYSDSIPVNVPENSSQDINLIKDGHLNSDYAPNGAKGSDYDVDYQDSHYNTYNDKHVAGAQAKVADNGRISINNYPTGLSSSDANVVIRAKRESSDQKIQPITVEYINQDNDVVGTKVIGKHGDASDRNYYMGDTIDVTNSTDGGLNVPRGYTPYPDQNTQYTFNRSAQPAVVYVEGHKISTLARFHLVHIDSQGQSQNRMPGVLGANTDVLYLPITGSVGDTLPIHISDFAGYLPAGYKFATDTNPGITTKHADGSVTHKGYHVDYSHHVYDLKIMPQDSDSNNNIMSNSDSSDSWQNKSLNNYAFWSQNHHIPVLIMQAVPNREITFGIFNQNLQLLNKGQTVAYGDYNDRIDTSCHTPYLKPMMQTTPGYYYDENNPENPTSVQYGLEPKDVAIAALGRTEKINVVYKSGSRTWNTDTSVDGHRVGDTVTLPVNNVPTGYYVQSDQPLNYLINFKDDPDYQSGKDLITNSTTPAQLAQIINDLHQSGTITRTLNLVPDSEILPIKFVNQNGTLVGNTQVKANFNDQNVSLPSVSQSNAPQGYTFNSSDMKSYDFTEDKLDPSNSGFLKPITLKVTGDPTRISINYYNDNDKSQYLGNHTENGRVGNMFPIPTSSNANSEGLPTGYILDNQYSAGVSLPSDANKTTTVPLYAIGSLNNANNLSVNVVYKDHRGNVTASSNNVPVKLTGHNGSVIYFDPADLAAPAGYQLVTNKPFAANMTASGANWQNNQTPTIVFQGNSENNDQVSVNRVIEAPNGMVLKVDQVPVNIQSDVGDSYAVKPNQISVPTLASDTNIHLAQNSEPNANQNQIVTGKILANNGITYLSNPTDTLYYVDPFTKPITVTYHDTDTNTNLTSGNINGTRGQLVDVTNSKDNGITIPSGYALNNNQRTVYQITNQNQPVTINVHGLNIGAEAFNLVVRKEHHDGTASDVSETLPVNVPVGKNYQFNAMTYKPLGYSLDSSKPSSVNGKVNANGLDPANATFWYRADSSQSDQNVKPIVVTYYDDRTGRQVGGTNVVNGYMNQTFNVYELGNQNLNTKAFTVDDNQNQTYQIGLSPINAHVMVHGNVATDQNYSDQAYINAIEEDPYGSDIARHNYSDQIVGNVGDRYDVTAVDYQPSGFELDQSTAHGKSGDVDLTGTIQPDGSINNNNATFYYTMSDTELHDIKPIHVYFKDDNDNIIVDSDVINADTSAHGSHDYATKSFDVLSSGRIPNLIKTKKGYLIDGYDINNGQNTFATFSKTSPTNITLLVHADQSVGQTYNDKFYVINHYYDNIGHLIKTNVASDDVNGKDGAGFNIKSEATPVGYLAMTGNPVANQQGYIVNNGHVVGNHLSPASAVYNFKATASNGHDHDGENNAEPVNVTFKNDNQVVGNYRLDGYMNEMVNALGHLPNHYRLANDNENTAFIIGTSVQDPVIQVTPDNATNAVINYENQDTHNVVAQRAINAQIGTKLSDIANQYVPFMPYNYTYASHDWNDNTVVTNNGQYTIYVNKQDYQAQPHPVANLDLGKIDVDYIDPQGQLISTDSLNQTNDTPFDANEYVRKCQDGGKMPNNFDYSGAALKNPPTKFIEGKPQQLAIVVSPTNRLVTAHIKYEDAKTHQFISDSGKPIQITVNGKSGDTLNYADYCRFVPQGYTYYGMGDHDNVIEDGDTDIIMVRQAKSVNQLGQITVKYRDSKTGQIRDTVNVAGMSNTPFNLGYYEDDVPDGYRFNGVASSNADALKFNSSNQTVTINIVRPQPIQKYGSITIHFVKADSNVIKPGVNGNQNTSDKTLKNALVPNNHNEVMTGRIGNLFSPEEYEHNTPQGTIFDHIVKGADISTITKAPQDIWIAVQAINGQF